MLQICYFVAMIFWHLIALLVRVGICIYTVLQITGQLNYYSMGISYGKWTEIDLPLSLFWINVIIWAESIGALLTLFGLFSRLGSLILFIVFNTLIYFTNFNLYEFWIAAFISLLLFIVGNGKYTLDRMIKG
jgi:uncharacterized membrane protein YphA (DoxX/SURF4 family)